MTERFVRFLKFDCARDHHYRGNHLENSPKKVRLVKNRVSMTR